MAKDTKLSGGVARSEPSEFDKFAASNLDKAVIGTPTGDGGVNPIVANGASLGPNTIEIPMGMTPAQATQMQAAFNSIMKGQTVAPVNPNVSPQQSNRDIIVPDTNTRMWNPMQPFQPTSRLSDMEASVGQGAVNPSAVMTNVPASAKLTPKVDCSPVLIECYHLLNSLIAGRWLLQGAPNLNTMLVRLKAEIENT